MMGDIAIVCGAGIVSGKEIMALELGRGLSEAGAEVHFVTSRWGSGEFVNRTQAIGIPTCRLWLGFISATLRLNTVWMTADQLLRWPSLWVGYRRFLKDVRPDKIIHTNWHHALLLWPSLRPNRDIYWLHELMPNKSRYRRLFQRLSKRLGCFVAVSHAAGKSLSDLGVPSDKIRVIHNGITDPARDDRQSRNTGTAIIGIVGQIGAWKGHEDLLQAFQVVLQTRPDVRLHIFGKGAPDYEAFLRRRTADLGVEHNVVWRGFVEDIAEVYREMDLLAIPSRCEEPFGLTAVEAGFFGIPVVAVRRGGLPEVVKDGVTGYLFKAGNVGQLTDSLINLISNPALRCEMGQNGRNRAQSLFSRDRFVRDFAAVLEIKSANARQNGHGIDHAA
jgi:glycosyltransferase involved in cell wall biosynthesis